MAMFDWYEPREIQCPECGITLGGWQGKDGPCALLVWREGEVAPARQEVDAEVALLPDDLAKWRLPPSFGIYSYDCPNHVIHAACRCVDEVWSETRVERVDAR